MRNKVYRKHKEHAKLIRRIKYWMLSNNQVWDLDGNKVNNPTITDCLNSPQSKVYKNTGTPCSCPICSGEKYDRNQSKKDFLFEIKNDPNFLFLDIF